MKIEAVINSRAGGMLDHAPEVARNRIERLLGDVGQDVSVTMAEPKDIYRLMHEAVSRKPHTLIVGGGDGTIRSAANILTHSEIALGILPLGTLNRLARNLDIPLRLEDAARAIRKSERGYIDVGEVNGRLFLCNSLMGLPLQVAQHRKELRGAPISHRLTGYTAMLGRILTAKNKIKLRLDDGYHVRRISADAIAVSNNAYDETPSLMLKKSSVSSGELVIYVTHHATGRERLVAIGRALVGRWRDDPKVEQLNLKSATLDIADNKIEVTNDGEIEELSTPLYYKIHDRALLVLKPKRD